MCFIVNMDDILGKKIGMLSVIDVSKIEHKQRGKYLRPYIFYYCICECGKEVERERGTLLTKKTKIINCGCYQKEIAKKINFKHGYSQHKINRTYLSMKERIYNPNNSHYKDYGGRGINICERWLNFEFFLEDMLKSYMEHVEKFGERNTTLDRIDVNGDYEPNNCRWATFLEQGKNKRNNKEIKVTHKATGEVFIDASIRSISRKTGVSTHFIKTVLRNETKRYSGDYDFEYLK